MLLVTRAPAYNAQRELLAARLCSHCPSAIWCFPPSLDTRWNSAGRGASAPPDRGDNGANSLNGRAVARAGAWERTVVRATTVMARDGQRERLTTLSPHRGPSLN
ncbi:hypothetical protein CC85DRAFT_85585 [Cutaneotrichosporon oleaginosum]|uniref:Uncharacterized protein n=1 Tax=Cutaneotrichosporon oleaginosum TaxID=879819 RepID=A0A0J0XMY0_9TREE|nr:uncharacterized protein CC85DRAFT_85585 [Cutaneotrichosporon oleaginosum]KLT42465.1 hypothetical protein CC85DRAFT_85585 [Cutaneotrichosporon oleaginosum]TXT06984.1 hypothetical protein COLE_06315 [Cutaneotrichosporon oleaginosum]